MHIIGADQILEEGTLSEGSLIPDLDPSGERP
jgi:hypothetical protein